MGRYRGTFDFSANLEPLVKAPLDARTKVDTVADLTNPDTWKDGDGNVWLTNGLTVYVEDEENKYTLIDETNYTSISAWRLESASDKFYKHVQGTPSDTWTVTHNLNKRPSVTVIDSSQREVIGGVEYIDNNNITLHFSDPFSGEAYFN